MLGKKIKEIREGKKISIDTLSTLSNVQGFRIKRLENDEINITLKTLNSILTALGKKLVITDDKQ